MYIGRIVCVGKTQDGAVVAGYRVSSRSFPNRRAVIAGAMVSIVPKPGAEQDLEKNPYIAYRCARIAQDGRYAVLTNGSHTDAIAEKLDQGMIARDALALSSLVMDYEKDQYNTPRVSAVADRSSGDLWLAVVRDNGLQTECVSLPNGGFAYVATYEEDRILEAYQGTWDVTSADTVCEYLLGGGVFAEREKPITAVAAVATDDGFAFAAKDAAI